ncbi:hypothetical protein [Lacticaseibacillus suihuaensis]
MRRRLAVGAFGLLVSAVIGLGAAGFLIADNALTALLWHGELAPGLVIGAAIVLLWGLQTRWPAAPATAAQALSALFCPVQLAPVVLIVTALTWASRRFWPGATPA